MVIKIKKPGVLPDTRILDCTCRNCKCEFEFNPPDAKLEYDQREGDFYRIKCPTCGMECIRAK